MRSALFVFTATSMLAAVATSACSTGCPNPRFAGPAHAVWSPHAVVVRWPKDPADPLPDRYYGDAQVAMAGRVGAAAKSVRSTGAREITIDIDDLDPTLRVSPRMEIDIGYPDQRAYVSCSHPGMQDSFSVRVTVDFDLAAHTASASFGPLSEHRGACSLSGQAGAEGGGGWHIAMLIVGGALARRLRTRRPAHEPRCAEH